MTTRKETMTPRERLLKALNHEQPDRVPIDLGGNQTGIHKVAYQALIEHLGIRDEVTIMDAVQQLARPCEAVLQRLRVDTRYIHAGAAADFRGEIVTRQRDGRTWHDLTDEFGVTWSMPDDVPLYMDITHHPLANATLEDIRDYPFPKGNDPGRFAGLRDRALQIRRETPYAVISGISGVVYEICWYMRGLERWFMDMIEQPEFCEALIDQTLKFWLDWFDVFLAEVGDVVDVIMIGDDIAGQGGPLFQPDFYRQVVKPRHKRLVQSIKSRTPAKIWYHTCGACQGYIPELVGQRHRHPQPGPDQRRQHGPRRLESSLRGPAHFLGRRHRRSTCVAARGPGNGPPARAPQRRDLQAGRWLRVQQRPQHPSRRACGEHPRHVRRSV